MARTILAVFRHVLFVVGLLGFAGPAVAEEYYYAVEMKGVLCGYARLVTLPLRQGTRELILLEHELVVKGTLLGGSVDNRILLTYHLDPVTKTFTYHDSVLEQGPSRLTSAIRIEGRTARVSDGAGGREQVIDLPADVVLDNTLFHPHLVADFVTRHAERRTYQLFDGRDNAVREMAYSRKGEEKLTLAGKAFDTVVLDSVDRRTGVNTTVWLDTRTGVAVQIRYPGDQRVYMAEAAVVEMVNRAPSRPNLDSSVMSKTNVSIPKIRTISYMRVRATAEPSGLRLTPEALNVPGQRFTGKVEDNLLEGVFEIEHRKYDGANAPPFPPDFGRDVALRPFLGPDGMIQSDDPVLGAKARETTSGSLDSWDAARRLSRWVAGHIKGAIPGGVTARGTYDQLAGECGGHSFLLAAFCRSVGIPARVVWGCLYTPHEGGAFGKHAWNEVFMGEAGWVPLDTTVSETDYVDSGHIRLGIHQSLATSPNIRSIEILEHRQAPEITGSGQTGATGLGELVGEYTHPRRGGVRVLEQGGLLKLDIPGKAVLSLKEPDADGRWASTLSDLVFVTFERNEAGRAIELRLHQVLRLRKSGVPPELAADVPADLRSYPGSYLLAQAQAEFTLAYESGGLVLHDPMTRSAVPLKASATPGTWADQAGQVRIRFETGPAGEVTAMTLDSATVFRR